MQITAWPSPAPHLDPTPSTRCALTLWSSPSASPAMPDVPRPVPEDPGIATAWTEVGDAGELRELLGAVSPRAASKARSRLHALDRQWLAASPFCLVATSAADGTCDVSPK